MKRNKISSAPLRGFVNNSVNDGNEKRAETAERRIRSARFFLSRSCLFSHLPERPSLFHFYFYNYFFFFLFFFCLFLTYSLLFETVKSQSSCSWWRSPEPAERERWRQLISRKCRNKQRNSYARPSTNHPSNRQNEVLKIPSRFLLLAVVAPLGRAPARLFLRANEREEGGHSSAVVTRSRPTVCLTEQSSFVLIWLLADQGRPPIPIVWKFARWNVLFHFLSSETQLT